MVQGSSDVSSLIDEVSSAFDALLSRNEAGAKLGPSPLNIYKAANLLYQLHQEPKLDQISQQTQQAFDMIIASMSDEYLSSLLQDILEAFTSLVQKAQKSLLDLTLQPNKRSLKDDLEKDLSKCFAALKPLQIVFGYKLGNTSKENMSETKKRCCRIGYQDILCVHLAFLYDTACQIESATKIQNVILNIFSATLTHGLLLPMQSDIENEDDNIQKVMDLIQQISSEQGQSSTCLGDLLLYQKQQTFIPQHEYFETMIETIFTSQVHAQKDYINLMLSSCPTSSVKPVEVKKPDSKVSSKPIKTKKISAMTRLVQQVQSVFGDIYGEGYIEAALACYNLDPEETTAALLELQTSPHNSNIHPRLKKLDPKLPSSRKDRLEELMNDDNQEKKVASKIQKAYLHQIEKDQEQEAYLLESAMGGLAEYNDDYDDQYDGVGGGEDGVGGLDGGLYDVDLEAIKTYNRITKGMEEERLFWEENRNTNRRQSRNNNSSGKKKNKNEHESNGNDDEEEDGTSGEKKYRGPDKGKGGRTIGPDGRYLPFPKSKKKGGGNKNQGQANVQQSSKNDADNNNSGNSQKKKGNDKKDASKEMSKIQKRRKNDNKAKIGNHHRKERALKKTAM
ncbi:hypothetical protein CTEN210_17988 [Chaetoceros tenuissimus]|uniref:CUE domain-containing protein n=1 Tax=Chaetoceros tenuissimus TaxID=426638 RepID=A0AAD3DBL0_9STRA|nr:hypothetical protein CTEN210_17988 [Chaetoceros tenuissimus]